MIFPLWRVYVFDGYSLTTSLRPTRRSARRWLSRHVGAASLYWDGRRREVFAIVPYRRKLKD